MVELAARTAMDPRGGGRAYAETASIQGSQSREPISVVIEQTIQILNEANERAERILLSLRGSQPSEGGIAANKEPDRSMILDANAARNLANRLVGRLDELHQVLGG